MTKEGVYVAGRFSKDTVVILVLLVVVIASWIPRLNSPIDLRFDSGVYYTLGTSLAEGKGYRLLNEPGEIAAVQYPPDGSAPFLDQGQLSCDTSNEPPGSP